MREPYLKDKPVYSKHKIPRHKLHIEFQNLESEQDFLKIIPPDSNAHLWRGIWTREQFFSAVPNEHNYLWQANDFFRQELLPPKVFETMSNSVPGEIPTSLYFAQIANSVLAESNKNVQRIFGINKKFRTPICMHWSPYDRTWYVHPGSTRANLVDALGISEIEVVLYNTGGFYDKKLMHNLTEYPYDKSQSYLCWIYQKDCPTVQLNNNVVSDQKQATRKYYNQLYQYWSKPKSIFYKNNNLFEENSQYIMNLFKDQITPDRLNADIIIEVPDFKIPKHQKGQMRLKQSKVSNSIVISFLALQDLKTDWVSIKFQ